MLTCAIIDDEPLAVKLLEAYVAKTPGLQLTRSYSSAVEALQGLRDTPAQLIFCDIQMPDLTGLEFANMLQSTTSRIIFTTAFSDYALEGYKVEALDYLLKPISYSDFLASVERAQSYFQRTATPSDMPPTTNAESPAVQAAEDCIFLKSDYKIRRIAYHDILYIEGLKDYIKVYLKDEPRPVLSLASMRSIEAALPSPLFLRTHRSFIVNMMHVTVIERSQVRFGDKLIPISEMYRDSFLQYVGSRTITR